jgi:Fur family transcriptional regulator, ferric uptake regulator
MQDNDSPIDILKNVGLKITKNREQVISILQDSKRPLNHQEIMEKLPKGQSWDRVTIYRALSDLESKKVLSTMLNGDRVTYFELKEELTEKAINHGHVICNKCGRIECVDDLGKQMPKSVKGFKISSMEVNFHGICKDCQ